MNMNCSSMPFEANYSDDVVPMPTMAPGSGMPMGIPMGMPSAGMGQMQMPMGNMGGSMPSMGNMGPMGMNQVSYPMQQVGMNSQPMGMMQPHSNQISMSMSQLPPGAVTPLSSVSVMPVMGGGGSIDSGAMNVVMPDIQPMSQMGSNQYMPQMNQSRMTGGASPASNNWMHTGNCPHMWNYGQGYPSHQHRQHHHHLQQVHQHQQQVHQPQQQQQHQQFIQQQPYQQQDERNRQNQQRMKAQYDYSKEARNGLNSPSTNDGLRVKNSSSYLAKKVSQWR